MMKSSTSEILLNDSDGPRSLTLQFVGRENNRRGVGVIVTIKSGNQACRRQIVGGGSYCSSHQPLISIALPSPVSHYDVEVVWPNGLQQSFSNVPRDFYGIVHERDGRLAPP